MSILLIADSATSFQGPYLRAMAATLAARGHQVATRVIPSSDLYRTVCHAARDERCDHVHLCFMQDAPALLRTLESEPCSATWSFSTFGLAAPARDGQYRAALDRLLARDDVTRALVHSNHPRIAARRASMLGMLQSAKAAWLHEPIYDDQRDFTVDREAARGALELPHDRRIALCFGTFSRKKGADLLAAAARRLSDLQFVFVGEGASAFVSAAPNVHVDGAYVEYREAALYYRACDFVVLPYRREYEDSSSGVLVQAALAARPSLVPAISPFRETVIEFELGATFECESVESLTAATATMARRDSAFDGFANYLAAAEPWSRYAELVDDRPSARISTPLPPNPDRR